MRAWPSAMVALVYSVSACGGADFGAVGGEAGTGGTAASGGSGGTSSGGTAGANVGGSAGEGGSSGGGSGGSGPITIVNESETVETTTLDVPTLTLSETPSAGNAIIVGITCISSADGNTTGDCIFDAGGVSDNQGNVYAPVVQGEPLLSSEQGARAYVFIAENIGEPSGAFVISVDPNGTSPPEVQSVVFGAIEVAGLAASPSDDASGISMVGGTDQTSTNAITDLPTLQANELAIGVLSMRSDDTNMLIMPEAGWTAHHVNQNGAEGHPPGHSMVSFVTTNAGQVSHTWTHDPPTRNVAAVIATFRGALTE